MVDPALRGLSFVCAYCGMGWLALGMKPHWRQVREKSGPRQLSVGRFRLLGGSALLLSLITCLAADHPSMASLVWVMTMSVSALSVAMTLSYAPRALRWLTAVVGGTRATAHAHHELTAGRPRLP
jgi:hypothetical protein